jgi:cytochrome c biogenesis protein CcdA
MLDAPYALALTAGILAAVNPCGFALLPAYLSLLVVGDRQQSANANRATAVARALGLAGAMALGFVAVFGIFGLLTAPVADLAARNLPWLSIVIGLVLAGMGGWLLAGRELPALRIPVGRGPAVRRGLWPMIAFGASYAIASLGCTIGPFLAVVVSAFRAGSSPAAGIALFLTYAAGMALVVGIVALAVAVADASLVRALRRAGPIINRLGGALLVVAGLYVAWYGWYEIRIFADPDATDPVIDAAGHIQTALSRWLAELGTGTVLIAFAIVLAAAITATVLAGRRRTATRPSQRAKPMLPGHTTHRDPSTDAASDEGLS